MQKMDDNGAAVNKFYGTAVNAGISAAGKLSEYAVYSAYALAEGRSLADAYDDMGGLTFNIGSLGMFADMMATGIARNNATGQAGKFGEISQKLEGKGILEINIGSNGIKGKFGMGGFDLAGSLYTFGKRMSDKAALEAYAESEGISEEQAQTAMLAYIYGDWTQENTAARIANDVDQLNIVKSMADGATAQTVQNKDGTGRVITMVDSGDKHQNAIQLGHESYRDGIVGNKADQQRETFNAVLGHTSMADRMTQYGNSFSGLLSAEIEVYQKGDMNALMMDSLYNYSSDADYWLFKLDGSIEDDGKYYFSREIINENGKVVSEKIDGSDFTGSRSLALLKAIGLDNIQDKMLDKPITELGQIPKDVIKSVLGIDIDKIPSSEYKAIFENNKEKLIAEYLLTSNGANWTAQTKKWEGGDLKIPGLETNDSLGVSYNKDTKEFTFFTAGMDIVREENAFDVGKITSPATAYDDYANTTVTAWRKNLFTNQKDTYVLSDSNGDAVNWTSV